MINKEWFIVSVVNIATDKIERLIEVNSVKLALEVRGNLEKEYDKCDYEINIGSR